MKIPALFRRGRHEYDPPERPIYADARWAGLTLTLRVKVLIVLVMLVLGLMIWWFSAWVHESNLRRGQRLADQARTDKVVTQLQDAQAEIQAEARRLAADEQALAILAAQNKADVRELACTLVSQSPDDPAKPIIHDFRVKYGCPPYNPNTQGVLASVPTAGGAESPSADSGVPLPGGGSAGRTPPTTRPRPPGSSPPPSSAVPTCLLLPRLCVPPGLPLPPLPIVTMLPTLP